MSIKPVPSGSTPRPGARRPVEQSPAAPAQPDQKARAAEKRDVKRADNVEVSAAAREIQGHVDAGAVPAGEMTPEQMAQVSDRLAKGFYDKPEVKDQVVERLSGDLDMGSD